jgi:hypothetical protein
MATPFVPVVASSLVNTIYITPGPGMKPRLILSISSKMTAWMNFTCRLVMLQVSLLNNDFFKSITMKILSLYPLGDWFFWVC